MIGFVTLVNCVYIVYEKRYVEYGLKVAGIPENERHDISKRYLDMMQLSQFANSYTYQLSTGMKQRVAIARALVMDPDVLLMDEPFGALDALTRAHLQDSLMEIQQQLGNTVIMITHDVDEAVLLSDRIVMMTNGPAASIGEVLPIDLPRPRNRVVLADDPDFNNYRQQVLRFLYEKQKNPTAKAA